MKTDEEIDSLSKEIYSKKSHPMTYYTRQESFIEGYKQAQKELYSEYDMKEAFNAGCAYTIGGNINFKQTHLNFKEWFNQNKKK